MRVPAQSINIASGSVLLWNFANGTTSHTMSGFVFNGGMLAILAANGGSFTGMIADENAAGLTVRRPGLSDETVLRQNLLRVTSSALSLMPEGLEVAISVTEMADLLAYLLGP